MDLVLFKLGSSHSSGANLDVRLNDTFSPVVDYTELVSLRFGAQTATTLVDGNRTSGRPEVSSITLPKYFDLSSIAFHILEMIRKLM